MIKQDFLDLMEAQCYDIGGIMHELLKITTYKEFFNQPTLKITSNSFRPLGESGKSTKVMEFISKHENSLAIVGPIHFFEYLTYHPSDNVLKLVVEKEVPASVEFPSSLDLFKEALTTFRNNFFNEDSIPFVSNLTTTVLADKSYMPVKGREVELKEIKRQFGKLMKNNVVLTGSGGVGKTAIMEEFAMQEMENYVVYELNVLGLVANIKDAPKILENILEIMSNLSGKKVLFIDEFHVLAKVGLADTIKRMTSRSMDIKFAVATTHDEFKKFIEGDKALERRFHPIPINEISGELLEEVLVAWCNKLQFNFGVEYDASIVKFVIEKMKVERQKTSPDKEKDIIDAAFSGCKLDGLDKVTKDSVAEVMASRLSVPKEQLMSTMFDTVSKLQENLKKEIKGQDNAIKNVVKVIESAQMIKRRDKPMAVMFFAGETSVGKTELAKQIAKHMFGSEKNLIRIDCTNYMEKHTMSSLLGSPPGYVGSENGGSLVNKLKQKPFSVILFDEFEKAHPDLQNIMLPMFEEGIVTDRSERIADVTNCIIILTSNIGADGKMKSSKNIDSKGPLKMGFATNYSEEEYEDAQGEVTDKYKSYLASINKNLKPELISRINEIVIFSKLSDDVIKEITVSQIEKALAYYKEDYGFNISYSDEVVDFIVKKGVKNPRKISGAISKHLQSSITQQYAKGKLSDGATFKLIVVGKVIAIELEEEE